MPQINIKMLIAKIDNSPQFAVTLTAFQMCTTKIKKLESLWHTELLISEFRSTLSIQNNVFVVFYLYQKAFLHCLIVKTTVHGP